MIRYRSAVTGAQKVLKFQCRNIVRPSQAGSVKDQDLTGNLVSKKNFLAGKSFLPKPVFNHEKTFG
jgi:hypothetical protein